MPDANGTMKEESDGAGGALLRWTVPIALIALGISLMVVYGWMYFSFWGDRPQLKRNVTAEINAPSREIPESERAWPRYRRALVKLKPDLDHWSAGDFEPSSNSWSEIAGLVAARQDAIAGLRDAARLPGLGYLYSNALHAEDAPLVDQPESADRSQPSENPSPVFLLLLPQTKLAQAARFLMVDARLAAAAHDSGRATADLAAAVAMAAHIREPRFAVSQLYSWQVVSEVCSLVGELLASEPDMFSDDELAELDRQLREYAAAGFPFDASLERATMEDIEQRWFTDDGQGDGHLYPELEGQSRSMSAKALLPLRQSHWKNVTISRKEYREKIAELFASVEQEFAQPVWSHNGFSFDRELNRLAEDARWFPVTKTFPDLSTPYFEGHRADMQVDATRAAIALARYRLAHGDWPESLANLVPELLDAVPLDRFDGEPLRYKLEDGEPCIYSVCLDRKDDSAQSVPFEVAQDLTTFWQHPGAADAASIAGDLILWPEPEPPSTDESPLSPAGEPAAAEPPTGGAG